jgi:hypothetical protein
MDAKMDANAKTRHFGTVTFLSRDILKRDVVSRDVMGRATFCRATFW